jgi:hypothetical protein
LRRLRAVMAGPAAAETTGAADGRTGKTGPGR